MFRDLRRALALLTILPAGNDDGSRPRGRAMAWFPLAGLLIGLLCAASFAFTCALAGETVAAALTLALWVLLTGGLHLDGWGDCCDALLCALPRERRLAIMKDPHAGSFAVVGLVLLLLVKFAALTAVRDLAVLIIVPAAARWAVVLAATYWPTARPQGMGDTFRAGIGRRDVLLATLLLAAGVMLTGRTGVVALAASLAALLLVARLATVRLGGLTGDVYGAIIEGAEALALVALTLLARIW